jgi:membrane protein DedA with SNARE-associated domain/rhodanese-related sulfurtransferase
VIPEKLLSLFAQHTYPILFLWVFCQQMGCPIPSAPILIAAGALCVVSGGGWIYTFGTVLAACILADLIWYHLGRNYGRRLLNCLLRMTLMSPASLTKASEKLARYNSSTLVFAKFVPGLSILAPPLSGHSGMDRSKFLFWDLVGSSLWASAWLLGGRLLLKTLKTSGQFIRSQCHTSMRIILCLIAAIVFLRIAIYFRVLLSVRRMRLSPQGLQAMISLAKRNAEIPPYVLDLRVPQDVISDPRQIPNAIRVDPNILQSEHHVIPRDRDVILYCSCPNEATSTLWALRLRRLGIVNVHLLRGGLQGWTKAGYELTPSRKRVAA